MNINDLIKQENDLSVKIGQIYHEREEIRRQIAEYNCPFKVGDLIKNKDGLKAKIEQILYAYCTLYEIKIRKIKKDGTPYAYIHTAYYSDEWEKVT